MLRRGRKRDKYSKLIKKMNGIVYDEHFTRATDSVDLMKSTRLADIGDGITPRKESEIERYTR